MKHPSAAPLRGTGMIRPDVVPGADVKFIHTCPPLSRAGLSKAPNPSARFNIATQ